MRFSIRDLLWLTLVAGLCLSWWSEHLAKRFVAERADRLEAALRDAKQWSLYGFTGIQEWHRDVQLDIEPVWYAARAHLRVNWDILDEPLVEP
jgi:hypothetical protein